MMDRANETERPLIVPSPSDFACVENDDRIVMSGRELRIVFERDYERWSHSLELFDPAVELARAVESGPEGECALRVTSPVYQEVQRHDLVQEPGICLLLTGRQFQHHFSAAVRLCRDAARPDCLVLDFDIALRCRAPLESLAATYRVWLNSSALDAAGPERVAWYPEPKGGGRLELCATPPSTLALAETGRQAVCVQVVAALDQTTFTQRLRYQWRWTRAADATR